MASVSIPVQKIILCGEYGVGKSSIFRRFANNCFVTSTDRKSTLGLDQYDKIYNINDKNIKLQLWDTGGMERVASITSSYYKFSEAAILVFSLDNPVSFHVLSQHLLDIVTYAENAKIYLCGNKSDLINEDAPQICAADIQAFCEQCHSLIVTTYLVSCKTGCGVEEMFSDIAAHLGHANRSKIDLQSIKESGFKLNDDPEESMQDYSCAC